MNPHHQDEEPYDLSKEPGFYAFAAAAAQYSRHSMSGVTHEERVAQMNQNLLNGMHLQPNGTYKPNPSHDQIRQKKETHREVERRRREIINAGIQQLSEIIPSNEKNKGRVLQSAIQYIQELKHQEAANLEKWTLEKLLFEQAIQEYSAQIDQLKAEVHHLRQMTGQQSQNMHRNRRD